MKSYTNLRIVFMGTPEFAVASLDALLQAGCNVVGVITAPDKPAGRGMQLQQSAVKKYAVQHNLNILQPEKLKNEIFINVLQNLQADLQIVVAFRMLPEIVWNMPPFGTINVHGSLLPQYRGAAPINWAIINGEKTTGVTTFKLKHQIDTGNILLQEKIEITENETAGTLHDKMKIVGANILVETVKGVAKSELQEIAQSEINEKTIRHAPKIFTETCEINFANTVDEVYNLVRGLSPFPTAFTFINGKKIKLFFCEKEVAHIENYTLGSYLTDNKTYLKFVCSNGFIHATDVQIEGKKRMPVGEFLKGFRENTQV